MLNQGEGKYEITGSSPRIDKTWGEVESKEPRVGG